MSKIIFIDESGTLPDPKDKIIIVAAVGVDVVDDLLDVIKKVRSQIQSNKKEKQISEIKFYKAGDRTKTIFLQELIKKQIDIFVVIVDKVSQIIPDTPENFALISYFLLEECFLFYRNEKIDKVVFDKHFGREYDQSEFNKKLSYLLGKEINFLHLDSQNNPEVNSADMVAGSLLWKYSGKNDKFYNIIKDRIISEKFINWKEARKRFFDKIKNLS